MVGGIMINSRNFDTDKDFQFTATDIQTGQITTFTLKDVIFSDTIRNKLHEEMQYDFIDTLSKTPNV